jgi:hypothetical protein
MTWRVADSCPCSTAHNKRSLLYPYGNIQQTGPVWLEALSVPYGYCLGAGWRALSQIGHRYLIWYSKSILRNFRASSRSLIISYTFLKHHTSKWIIFFILTEDVIVKVIQKLHLHALVKRRDPLPWRLRASVRPTVQFSEIPVFTQFVPLQIVSGAQDVLSSE